MYLGAVFLGGGLGSVLRYFLSAKVGGHWGIMLVNISGALLIGAAYQYFSERSGLRPEYKAFIMTGLLGGFTTFSTYLLDFNSLLRDNRIYEGLAYLAGSVVVGIIFLIAGMRLAKIYF